MNILRLILSVIALRLLISISESIKNQKAAKLKALQNPLSQLYQIQAISIGLSEEEAINNIEQCKQNDLQKVLHPDTQEEDFYVYRAYDDLDSLRDVVRSEYFDSQPLHQRDRFQKISKGDIQAKTHPSKVILLNVYSQFTQLEFQKDIQAPQHLSCLFQKSIHYLTPSILASKVDISILHQLYNKQNVDRSSQCIKDSQFQKPTYHLWDIAQCQAFWKQVNLSSQSIDFVFKDNSLVKDGITLGDNAGIRKYSALYSDGEECGKVIDPIIAQEFINNPITFKGRKFDVRIYLLVISTKPLIVYYYTKPTINMCAKPVNDFTQLNQKKRVRDSQNIKEVKNVSYYRELRQYEALTNIAQMWTLDQFESALIQEGYDIPEGWSKREFQEMLQTKFTHLFQSLRIQSYDDARFGDYAACDFNIDHNLQLWLLRCTRNPNFRVKPFSSMYDRIREMHRDALKLIKSYNIQRYKLIKRILEQLLNEVNLSRQQKKKLVKRHLKEVTLQNLKSQFKLVDFKQGNLSCQRTIEDNELID